MRIRTTIVCLALLTLSLCMIPPAERTAAMLIADPPECAWALIFEDGSYQGFETEAQMWAAYATAETPVVWAGSVANAMGYGLFRGLKPRLTTCIMPVGAES